MLEYSTMRYMAKDVAHDDPKFIFAVSVQDAGEIVRVSLRITDMGPGMAYEFKIFKGVNTENVSARMEYAEKSVRNFLNDYTRARKYGFLYYTLCDG